MPIEDLLEAFLSRYRQGERPSVEEWVQRYPEQSEEIRDLLRAMLFVEECARG
jgi:hypothetical protein